MRYEKVSFNTKAILKYSEQDFVNRFYHLWPGLEDTKKESRLKEVYKLAKLHENNKAS